MRPRAMILTVGADGEGERLDAYLAAHTELSRTAVARLCEEGAILVGGKAAQKNARLTPGTEIVWEEPAPVPPEAVAQEIPLDIVYEDGDLLVINKPCPRQPGRDAGQRTALSLPRRALRCGGRGATRDRAPHR